MSDAQNQDQAETEKARDHSPGDPASARRDKELEGQKERVRRADAEYAATPRARKEAEFQAKLREHNDAYKAQEKARADAAEAARAEELRQAKAAWAAKEAREGDDKILQWHRAQKGQGKL